MNTSAERHGFTSSSAMLGIVLNLWAALTTRTWAAAASAVNTRQAHLAECVVCIVGRPMHNNICSPCGRLCIGNMPAAHGTGGSADGIWLVFLQAIHGRVVP